MKKILYTTTAFVLCGGIVQANAACIATPSCTTLGYTSTSSCTGGLKCPFGNYWYCPSSVNLDNICELMNYKYSCTGTGYLTSIGEACSGNGKYTKCECAEGFEWQDYKGCVVEVTNCNIGDIFYSDRTCSLVLDTQKKPIGVVVYSDGQGHGQAMALNSIGNYAFSKENGPFDRAGLTPSEYDIAKHDLESCDNTEKITAYGDKDTYPAAWAVHEYSTEGTKAGDWCLPAAAIFASYADNKEKINATLEKLGGTALTSSSWTSTKTENKASSNGFVIYIVHTLYFSGRSLLDSPTCSDKYDIRPVIEF